MKLAFSLSVTPLLLIQVVVHTKSSLLLSAEQFHGMVVLQFNHSLIEGHLGCFQFWAIMNKAAINFDFCVDMFLLVWDKCTRVA